MSCPLGQFVLVLSLSFLFRSHTHTYTLSLFHIYSLSLSLSPSSILCLPISFLFHFLTPPFHLLILVPASGHPLTAMMTSFSGLREVSLLASLNGSLWWPRYGSQSSQRSATDTVFNATISLTTPQVVAWVVVCAESCFFALLANLSLLSVSPTPAFFWSLTRSLWFSFPCFVSLLILVRTRLPLSLSLTGCI